MGYYWTMQGYSIHIEKKMFSAIYEAAASFMHEKRYSQRDVMELLANTSGHDDRQFVEDLFSAYGFFAEFDDSTGDLVDIEQDGEKLVDQEELLRLVTPFLKEEGFVDGVGEEHERWQWVMSPQDGFSEQNAWYFYEKSGCPMKGTVTCESCPFSLVCNTAEGTALQEMECAHCGGKALYKKDVGDGTRGLVAATTCTCLERKFSDNEDNEDNE